MGATRHPHGASRVTLSGRNASPLSIKKITQSGRSASPLSILIFLNENKKKIKRASHVAHIVCHVSPHDKRFLSKVEEICHPKVERNISPLTM